MYVTACIPQSTYKSLSYILFIVKIVLVLQHNPKYVEFTSLDIGFKILFHSRYGFSAPFYTSNHEYGK